jgi:copper chaperone
MEKITLSVTGMSCSHCEKAVVDGIIEIGVDSAIASAKEGTVTAFFDPAKIKLERIVAEIDAMGYEVETQ